MATAPSYPSGVEVLNVSGTTVGDHDITFTADTVINSFYFAADMPTTGTTIELSLYTGAASTQLTKLFKLTTSDSSLKYHVDVKAAAQGDYSLPMTYPTVTSVSLDDLEIENLPAVFQNGDKLRVSIGVNAVTSMNLIVAGIIY